MRMRKIRLCIPIVAVVSASLAGCAGPQAPIDAPGLMPQIRASATYAEHRRSWMLPEAKSGELLYLSGAVGGGVRAYSFPKMKLVGTLSGFQQVYNLCSDKHGNVFVPDFAAKTITEYAHGGSDPVATLSDPGESPSGCSVDPETENLAVVSWTGGVAIYAGARGTPTLYGYEYFSETYDCAYDGSGWIGTAAQWPGPLA